MLLRDSIAHERSALLLHYAIIGFALSEHLWSTRCIHRRNEFDDEANTVYTLSNINMQPSWLEPSELARLLEIRLIREELHGRN